MKLYGHLCIILFAEASSNEIYVLRKTRAVAQTNVVSLTFCESNLPAEDNMGKKTLEEVHTYAELKHDPRASLPDSFTVCSTIMTSGCQREYVKHLGLSNYQMHQHYCQIDVISTQIKSWG